MPSHKTYLTWNLSQMGKIITSPHFHGVQAQQPQSAPADTVWSQHPTYITLSPSAPAPCLVDEWAVGKPTSGLSIPSICLQVPSTVSLFSSK